MIREANFIADDVLSVTAKNHATRAVTECVDQAARMMDGRAAYRLVHMEFEPAAWEHLPDTAEVRCIFATKEAEEREQAEAREFFSGALEALKSSLSAALGVDVKDIHVHEGLPPDEPVMH